MRKNEMQVGRVYQARMNNKKIVNVKLEGFGLGSGFNGARQKTTYLVTNLATGGKMVLPHASRFIGPVN